MTVCAIVILKDAVVAIADGRLTSGSLVSFNTTQKICQFRPRYRYPVITMDRFNYFEERFGIPWHLMYAGTYALCSEVINEFVRRITGLYLTRDYDREGFPVLSTVSDVSGHETNDYNFRPEELPIFDRKVLTDEFRECLRLKADEWLGNGKPLDCQFILFGSREKGDTNSDEAYLAYEVSARPDHSFINRAQIEIRPVSPNTPCAIGDPSAVATIVTDWELQERVKRSHSSTDPKIQEIDWWDEQDAAKTTEVIERLIEVVKGLSISTVGGNLLVASGQNGRVPEVRSA